MFRIANCDNVYGIFYVIWVINHVKKVKSVSNPIFRQLSTRIQSANFSNVMPKPEKPVQQSPIRRPLTGPTHTKERALKRRR